MSTASPPAATISLESAESIQTRRRASLPMGNILAVLSVLAVLVGIWYFGAIYYNTGALAIDYSNLGQSSVWAHMSMWRQWGAALNAQTPVVPAPHQVIGDLWSRLAEGPNAEGNLWVDLVTTGTEAVLGFLLGSAVALGLALAFVRSRVLELSLFPYVVMSQTVPIIALVPALVVIFGVGLRSKVIVVAYLAFYPTTVSAVKGLRSIEPLAQELMRSYAASTRQVFWKLRLPYSLPFVFTGLKIGVTGSLIGAIVSEITGQSQFGLGQSILFQGSDDQLISLWSSILAAGLLGLLLYGTVVGAERVLVRNRREDG